MGASEAVARMLTLVPWLLERPGASVAETASAFGVSEAVIRSDLGHLDFCGLPGLGGGDVFEVHLEDDRIVLNMIHELRRPMRLTPAEALRLVLTLDAASRSMGDELPALATALGKVRAAAGVPDGAVVTVHEHDDQIATSLRRALGSGHRVAFDYVGRADGVPRRRRVDPWQLDVTDEGWYLRGHDVDAGAERSFRLDRMRSLAVTDEVRDHEPPELPLAAPSYPDGNVGTTVRLRLGPTARWIAERLSLDAREEVGDDLVVSFRTDALPWVAELVRTARGEAVVLAPHELGRMVARTAVVGLERHEAG